MKGVEGAVLPADVQGLKDVPVIRIRSAPKKGLTGRAREEEEEATFPEMLLTMAGIAVELIDLCTVRMVMASNCVETCPQVMSDMAVDSEMA